MFPTLQNLALVVAAACLISIVAAWCIERLPSRRFLVYALYCTLAVVVIVFLPEPTAELYREDIDSRVSFVIMQVAATLMLLIGLFVGACIAQIVKRRRH
jgi:uncharacterized membrane protein YfcA